MNEHTEVLNELHAYIKFLSPHYSATMARLIIIEDKVKGLRDWVANLDFSSRLRKVANDTLNRDTSKPNNLSAFQRPESRALMSAHPSTIFDVRKSVDNGKGCAVGVFHDSQVGKPEKLGKCRNTRIAD